MRGAALLCCGLAVGLGACQAAREAPGPSAPTSAPTSAPGPSAPASASPGAPTAGPALQRFEARLMGTVWQLSLRAPPALARAAADAAFTEVARLEALHSEWRPDSEISRLNQAAGGGWIAVSPETLAVLTAGRAVGEASGGAFDVTWAALRGLWDFQTEAPRLPGRSALEAAVARVDYRQLALDPAGGRARLTAPGAALGLGGVAKGYAIDRVVALLRARGLSDFIVDGGGDLYLAGERGPGAPWTVGVRHPRADRILASLQARDAAVVSSGDYERFFEFGGRRYHHILDPRTGLPASGCVAVTVRAADATTADAWATALFVLGPAGLDRRPPGVEAALLTADGAIHVSAGLAGQLPACWSPPCP